MTARWSEEDLADYKAKREAPLNGTALARSAPPVLQVGKTNRFIVFGKAEPAGSKQAFVPLHPKTKEPYRNKNGGIVVSVVDDNPASRKWKKHVAKVAREEYGGPVFGSAVKVTMIFYRERPKSHFTSTGLLNKTGRETPFPITKPDSTKLFRCAEDALKSICWFDDSQVVKQYAEKLWGTPRVEITVEEILVADPSEQPELFHEQERMPWE